MRCLEIVLEVDSIGLSPGSPVQVWNLASYYHNFYVTQNSLKQVPSLVVWIHCGS